jgi:hypothetical protein
MLVHEIVAEAVPLPHGTREKERLTVPSGEQESREIEPLPRPVSQQIETPQPSRRLANPYDRQVTSAFVALDLRDDRIAGVSLNIDLRICTWRPAGPSSAGLDAGLFVRGWSREVHFVRRLAAESFVGSVLIIPTNCESYFSLEFSQGFWDRDQTQNLFQRAMEAFHHGDATSLADRSKSRKDVHGLAPHALEVFTLELATLIDNQVSGPYLLGGHNSVQPRSHFLGSRSALENGESHGPPGIVIDHVQHPPTYGPSLSDRVGNPVGPESAGDRHRR